MNLNDTRIFIELFCYFCKWKFVRIKYKFTLCNGSFNAQLEWVLFKMLDIISTVKHARLAISQRSKHHTTLTIFKRTNYTFMSLLLLYIALFFNIVNPHIPSSLNPHIVMYKCISTFYYHQYNFFYYSSQNYFMSLYFYTYYCTIDVLFFKYKLWLIFSPTPNKKFKN